ncbi:MAG: hypothetical protein AB2A00_28580 [Myxococcota bacterium]
MLHLVLVSEAERRASPLARSRRQRSAPTCRERVELLLLVALLRLEDAAPLDNWHPVVLVPSAADIQLLAISASAPDLLYAASNTAVYRGDPASALQRQLGPSAGIIFSIAPANTPSLRVFVGGANGLFVSEQAGASWTEIGDPFSENAWAGSLVFDPTNPSTVYVVSARGVHRSTTGGI